MQDRQSCQRRADSIKQRNQQYHAEHRDEHNAKVRAYHATHQEERRQYLLDRTEHTRQTKREWYIRNRERIVLQKRQLRQTSRTEERLRAAELRRAHPLASRAKTARRRATKKNLPGVHSKDDILALLSAQHSRCAYCHTDLDGNEYEIDHIIPITRPGSNNWPSNLVLTCCWCNRSKSNKSLAEWRPDLIEAIAALKGCSPKDILPHS